MYQYNCNIVRVIDGDTVVVDIDLGFDCWLKDQHVRFPNINAPEVRTRDLAEKEAGFTSRDYVLRLLPVGSKQVMNSYSSKGKYGRIIGDFEVYDVVTDSTKNLTEMMIRDGMAIVYG